jgi:hypothetical protein
MTTRATRASIVPAFGALALQAITIELIEEFIAAKRRKGRRSRASSKGITGRVLYLTAAMTGLRRGELLALRWHDIDWSAGVVRVRRNYTRDQFGTPRSRRSSRAVPLAQRVRDQLRLHHARSRFQAPADLVFPHLLPHVLLRVADPVAELVGDREAVAAGRDVAVRGLRGVDDDQSLGRDDHPGAVAEVALLDPQAEQVLGDRLHRDRDLVRGEGREVLRPELVRARVGVPGRRGRQRCVHGRVTSASILPIHLRHAPVLRPGPN